MQTKKLFLHLSILLIISSTIQAQNNSVIMAHWEHQTNTPQTYPNYLEDAGFTDSLKTLIGNWLIEEYTTSKVDFKQRNPVTFVSVISPPTEPRSIESTDYSLSMGLFSTLESGLIDDRYKPEEGILKLDVWLLDKKGRKIFKNKTALRFIIARKPSNYNDIYMSREDFQKLYTDGLKAALNIHPAQKMYVFQQPENERYNELMSPENSLQLHRINRGVFEIKGAEAPLTCRLDLETPVQQGNNYSRSAQFLNPFNLNTYRLETLLKADQAYRFYSKIVEDSKVLAELKAFTTYEEFRLETNLHGDDWLMSRNLFSNLIKIQKYGRVFALLVYEGGDPDYDARYRLFFSAQCTNLDKVIMMNLLGLEALIQTVQKFYEVETRHK